MVEMRAEDETGKKHEVLTDYRGRLQQAPRELEVVDYATLTVSTTALGFIDASPAMGADNIVNGKLVWGIEMTVEDNALRYRQDGTAPTSTEGHELFDEDYVNWKNGYSKSFPKTKFIRSGGADAKLKITYWGEGR